MSKGIQQTTKKKYLIGSMLVSSVMLILLLATSKQTVSNDIRNLAQIDSLVLNQLSQYDIRSSKFEREEVQINEFTRITYKILVPKDQSKTQIHQDINSILFRYNLRTPAIYSVEENKLSIHTLFRNSIIRSYHLITDTSTVKNRYSGSILFMVEKKPSIDLLKEVVSIGDKIGFVIRTMNPDDAENWYRVFRLEDVEVDFLLSDQNSSELLKSSVWLKDKLPRFAAIYSKSNILINKSEYKSELLKPYQNFNIKTIDLDNQVKLDVNDGIFTYEQSFRTFEQDFLDNNEPILTTSLNQKNIDLIKEKLRSFKKRGLNLIYPK